jgi:GAF domain-containing protein
VIYHSGVTDVGDKAPVIAMTDLTSALENAPDEVATALHELGHMLVAEDDIDTTLQRVVDLAARTIEGCDAAGVTLDDRNGYVTAASTDERTLEVDSGQYAVGDGPCLTAMRDVAIVRVSVDEAEERWPRFVADARSHDVRSFLAAPLVVRGRAIGALNLYSRSADGFGRVDDVLVSLYGAQAAIALANARTYEGARRLSEQLQEAISSRAVIEQAKGILMAEHRVGPDEAFGLLRTRSTRSNIKLRVIAEQIVAGVTGSDPGQNSRGTSDSMPRSSS